MPYVMWLPYVPSRENIKAVGKAAVLRQPKWPHKGVCICVNTAHGQPVTSLRNDGVAAAVMSLVVDGNFGFTLWDPIWKCSEEVN